MNQTVQSKQKIVKSNEYVVQKTKNETIQKEHGVDLNSSICYHDIDYRTYVKQKYNVSNQGHLVIKSGFVVQEHTPAVIKNYTKYELMQRGIQTYQIFSNADEQTCDICSAMEGRIFNIDEFEVGKTAPPFHPNCRCTLDIEPNTVSRDSSVTVIESAIVGTLNNSDLSVLDAKNNETWYGGNQNWFGHEIQKNGGCGPTAAANIFVYMALQNAEIANAFGIDPNTILTKEEYEKFMETVYQTVIPMELPLEITLGIWKISNFNKKVETFAQEHGLSFASHKLENQLTSQGILGGLPTYQPIEYQQGLDFIKTAIDSSHPVALLNMFSGISMYDHKRKDANFERHWVTITGYEQKFDDTILTVSSWGKEFIMSYKELSDAWQTPLGYMGGMSYFEGIKE